MIPYDADGIEAVTQACLAAHEAVTEHGSPDLKALSRLLPLTLASEVAELVTADTESGRDA